MIAIGKVLVSEDLLDNQFACNLNACKGACCVQGDSGAKLTTEECGHLEDVYDDVKEYLTPEGREVIEKGDGFYTLNNEGDPMTTLIEGKACAYVRYIDGIALCGIESAWRDGKTWFMKPVSCHLYPIRTIELDDGYEGVNYERWDICNPACSRGQKQGIKVYSFLKDALVRKYGEEFYEALEAADKFRDESLAAADGAQGADGKTNSALDKDNSSEVIGTTDD